MQTYSEYAPTSFDHKGLALPDQQDWLVVIGRNRDSGCLENSNFDCALSQLNGESDNVEVHNFGHWACGWLEIIIVKPDTPEAKIAEDIESSLVDYPVLDDSDLSEREFNEYQDQWRSWGASEFRRDLVALCDLDEEREALDAADDAALQEFYESLIPSGEFYDHDGSPNVSYAIRNATSELVVEFLIAQGLLAPMADDAARIEDDRQGEIAL